MRQPRLHSLIFIASIAAALSLASCQKELNFDREAEQDHNIIINFNAIVDTSALIYGQEYRNFFDEPYKVTAFKFYIHRIQMINTDSGKVFELPKDQYHLIDFGDSNSTRVKLGIQPFKYNRIAFTIGVDSARNVSGAQTDALDPAKGMFWTWNTGYIMAKLEGNSPMAATPNNAIEYHIGGFKTGENVAEKITLLFPYTTEIDLKAGKTSELTISANVNAWFFNPHDIMISAHPTCMTPGTLAMQIAENYRKMFTVVDIVNEP
ncbi:MAG: hypothetical protein EOO00_10250 [Chitinophagaceae bacterium]|nr:MAG: hypothetical protein EOO00_10250 [Chitinophagaceae bacterium]